MTVSKGNIAAAEEQLIEKTLEAETVFSGKVFDVEVRKIELADGRPARREIVLHNGGATICALDSENNIFMVRQFRSPFGKILMELPAGKLEKGEDPKACAIRELKEETGMTAEKIQDLGFMYSTPGYCSEKIYMYLATGLSFGDGNPDDGEFLQVIKIPLREAVDKIMQGEISDGKTVAAILKAARMVGI